jgi:hypothetical protein
VDQHGLVLHWPVAQLKQASLQHPDTLRVGSQCPSHWPWHLVLKVCCLLQPAPLFHQAPHMSSRLPQRQQLVEVPLWLPLRYSLLCCWGVRQTAANSMMCGGDKCCADLKMPDVSQVTLLESEE